jgi:small subunit ribosomal protein S16
VRGLAALISTGSTTTVAVKIRLKRMGKIRSPFYRVVVMDSRTKRDGRAIEEIGKYHPTEEPSLIQIDSDRAQYWLSNGAQPTEAVAALLKITGDWQKYKGEPGAEGTLRVKEPKTSKKDLYEAALAAAGKSTSDDASGSTPPRKRAAKKAAVAQAPADDVPAAEAPATETPAADVAEPAATEAPAAEATVADLTPVEADPEAPSAADANPAVGGEKS